MTDNRKQVRTAIVDPPTLRPESYSNVVSNVPLASSLLSGYAFSRLKNKGLEVAYLDASTETDLDLFERRVKDLKAKELFVHLLYQWENTEKILMSLGKIRASSGAKLSLFGYFPTFFKGEIQKQYPFIDSIIEGDPFIQNNGEPENDPFPMMLGKGDCAPILGSRGCWGDCSFCYAGRFFRGYRRRGMANIVDEIEQRLSEGFRKIYFVDQCFFPPGKLAGEVASQLAGEILKRGLRFRFGLECRADTVSEDTLDPLIEVGLNEIFLGIESGAQSALDRFNKKITVKQNEKAIGLIHERKIKLSSGFIMFDPEVTLIELSQNLAFLKRNDLLNCATNAAQLLSHKTFVYAGAPIYQRYMGKFDAARQPRYFIDYPFQNKKIQRIYLSIEKEVEKVYQRFRGEDIDNPFMEGSQEAAGRLSHRFEVLLQNEQL